MGYRGQGNRLAVPLRVEPEAPVLRRDAWQRGLEVRCEPDSCGACGSGVILRKLLFVCARNRLRSPTAEAIFSDLDGFEVSSAGTAPDAECVISSDLIEWADVVFVMEQRQKTLLKGRFGTLLQGKRLVCLGVSDRFGYMQEELIALLRAKVLPLLY